MIHTSICLLVFATSSGQVAAAARLPATKPAEKFTPSMLAALASSPTTLRSRLLTGSRVDQQIAEKGTSRASCAPRPVQRAR